MRRDLTRLTDGLAEYRSGSLKDCAFFELLVAQVVALAADLSEMEEDSRREFSSERVGGSD